MKYNSLFLLGIILVLFLSLSLIGVSAQSDQDECGFFCKIGSFFSNIFSGFTGSVVSEPVPEFEEAETISVSVKVAKG